MYIGFASDELSSAAISDYLTRVVQPLLATVEGVASADILGGQTFAMRLWLDPVRMAAHNISANDVNLAIRANNYQSAPGQAKGFYTITNISADTGLTDIDQFKRMVVKAAERRGGAARRHRHGRTRRAELEFQRHDERPAGHLHRRPGDPDRQPADHRQGRAGADTRDQAQPAALDEDAGRLRFDAIHPGLDRRGANDAGRGGRRSSSS